jgi:hypothetical protein
MWLKKIFAKPLFSQRLCGEKNHSLVLANPHFPIDINSAKTYILLNLDFYKDIAPMVLGY